MRVETISSRQGLPIHTEIGKPRKVDTRMVDAVVGAHDLALADFDSLYIQPALASLAFRTAACIFILF